MSGSLNKVMIIGNLGIDPEVRYLESGVPVASLRVATSETYKDRTSGERKTQTEWHNVVLWRGLAEVAEKYLKKGSKVYIEGKLRTRNWQDKEGNQRYTTEIVGDTMTMLDRASDSPGGAPSEQSSSQQPAQTQEKPSKEKEQKQDSSDFTGNDNDGDDLPF